MSVRYHCSHLSSPSAPLGPSYPSSSSSLHPLPDLYFCEECDAIRCNLCVGMEVASYYCPGCNFDVPSANVRGDKNRCARSCFSCPQCAAMLAVAGTEALIEPGTSVQPQTGPPYLLVCAACRWSSREIGWEFDKPSSIAAQVQKLYTQPEIVQAEFDSLKDHFEGYITRSAPGTTPASSSRSRLPSRHISHLTQMAAKALHREIPSLTATSSKRFRSGASGESKDQPGKDKLGWDELADYATRLPWKDAEMDELDMESLDSTGPSGLAALDVRWTSSWHGDVRAAKQLPQRLKLLTKMTKRCPDPGCRHLLIQPDTKTTRMKIKMVAMNYLPVVEVGRRRRRLGLSSLFEANEHPSAEDLEKRRRERRRTRAPGKDEDEDMGAALIPGEVYTFQLAFTNPLYDSIQIRLTQSTRRSEKDDQVLVHISHPHFTVSALKDAWSYEDEEEEDDPMLGVDASTLDGSEETPSTLGKRSRLSVLNTGGGLSSRDKRKLESGVEKKGNVSKVVIELEVHPEARGQAEADFEVRLTYRADDLGADEKGEKGQEEYKTFTFWSRVCFGQIGAKVQDVEPAVMDAETTL